MLFKSKLNTKLLSLAVGIFTTLPAFAHVDASHLETGFATGFMHPMTGLDHLLAMFAVGLWAAQNKGRARWMLPVVFPLMMAFGAILGTTGMQITGIETGIAMSVALLGLLIAFAVKLPLLASSALISMFAMVHGYAHGVEMPATASGMSFGGGFMLATATLHLLGFGVAWLFQKASIPRLTQTAGIGIAATGVYFLSAMG